MTPEEKALLQKTVELEQENRSLLLSIKRQMRISSIMSVVYWLFIIGTAIGAFYLFQPYWDQLKSSYEKLSETLSHTPR